MRQTTGFAIFSLSLSFLVFFTFFHNVAATNNSLIQETCNKTAENDPNVSYEFCMNSLQSSPASWTASDLRQLGNISIRLIRYNATDTKCYIKQLLMKMDGGDDVDVDPYVKQCLRDCYELYSDSIPTIQKAARDYKFRRYDDANIEVSAAMEAPTTCEDGFNEENMNGGGGRRGGGSGGVVSSPLTKRNNDMFKLSAIALSIINMLPR